MRTYYSSIQMSIEATVVPSLGLAACVWTGGKGSVQATRREEDMLSGFVIHYLGLLGSSQPGHLPQICTILPM